MVFLVCRKRRKPDRAPVQFGLKILKHKSIGNQVSPLPALTALTQILVLGRECFIQHFLPLIFLLSQDHTKQERDAVSRMVLWVVQNT